MDTNEPKQVSVVVPARLSHTGYDYRREAPIDSGVAEIVRRLNHPVFGDEPVTCASCDGHGQTWPSVHLETGDVLVQMPAAEAEQVLDAERSRRTRVRVAERLGPILPTRWVDQDKFGEDEGNCFAACVASVLCMQLHDVPNFCADKGRDEAGRLVWFKTFRAWLVGHGLTPVVWNLNATLDDAREQLADHLPDTLMIVSGKAERGLVHATVWRGGEMVHDPHPSRVGLLDVHDAIMFVPRDPSPGT